MKTTTGIWDQNFIDFEKYAGSEQLASGEDLSQQWSDIIEYYEQFSEEYYDYNAAWQNSNGAADGAAAAAGLGEPQNDGPGEFWSPGSNDPPVPNPDPDGMNFPGAGLPGWYNGTGPFLGEPVDPLVLDLDDDGLEVIPLRNSTANFDLNIDNFAEHTAWIGGDDGFVVWDRNNDGVINNRSEMFGGATQNGFLAITELDSNEDGAINASDSGFQNLKIWRDIDSDGLTDSGELSTFSVSGIASISLNYHSTSKWYGGTLVDAEATFTKTSGATGLASSVWFEHNLLSSIYAYGEEFTYAGTTRVLPNLRGYGDLTDLWVAFEQDSTLKALAESVIGDWNGSNIDDIRSGFEAIIFRWAGADGVSPTSRGAYVNGQHLAFLEALHGDTYPVGQAQGDPIFDIGPGIERYYEQIFDSLFFNFMVQVPDAKVWQTEDPPHITFGPYAFLERLSYSPYSDAVMGNLEDAVQDIHEYYQSLTPGSPASVSYLVEAGHLLSLSHHALDLTLVDFVSAVDAELTTLGVSAV